jgi:hypothetical protein
MMTQFFPSYRSFSIVPLVVGLGGLACSSSGLGSAANNAVDAGPDSGAVAVAPNVVISAATPTARTTTWSVNYWQWTPTWGNNVAGTESLVAALTPAYIRVGGYNNDANTPDPFDDAQMDTLVAYATAIGAQPIIQVPLLQDTQGQAPTAATAAEMVRYANVTKGYAIKYFSIGNEPDIYATQGLPSDSSKPAIANYQPTDYCTTARAFVTAMKAVDPSILIVGPDLAWKFQAGTSNDWLTPILQNCGDLFDVIAIHRYPFEAAQATLSAAAVDAAQYRSIITSVKGILKSTGYGQKPLALTEMNVAYNATSCVLGASPGTVGSALWVADSLGTSMELGLWTSAIWNISDTDSWSLGFLGGPPTHLPRPEYYAYQMFAEHVGPTQLSVASTPTRVSVYASRSAANSGTQVIVVNWNTTTEPVAIQVTGLASMVTTPTFDLPAESLAAFEIPDTGTTTAWVYGEAQRVAAAGPVALAANVGPASYPDAGAGAAGRTVGFGCQAGSSSCTQTTLASPLITTNGTGSNTSITFGQSPYGWGSYAYAATGQSKPTASVPSDGNGLSITGGFGPLASSADNWEGFGLYFSSSSCLNVSTYTGIKFDFSGDLGGCGIQLGASFSGDLATVDDATRGACVGTDSTCYGPSADVTHAALAATADAPAIQVPFTSLVGGTPIRAFDPSYMVSLQWQLSTTTSSPDGGSCWAKFTVSNVSFY